MENAPRNTSSSWIKYTFNKGLVKGFGFAGGHSAVSIRNTLSEDIVLPGYLVVNCGIHYKYRHSTVAMNVNNITNTTYWSGAYNNVYKWPGAPRNIMIKIGYRF